MQHKSYYKRNLLGCRSGENTAGVVLDRSKPKRLGGKGNDREYYYQKGAEKYEINEWV